MADNSRFMICINSSNSTHKHFVSFFIFIIIIIIIIIGEEELRRGGRRSFRVGVAFIAAPVMQDHIFYFLL